MSETYFSPYPRVLVFPNVLDIDACTAIISRFENDQNNKYVGGIASHGKIERSVKITVELGLNNPEWQDIDKLVYEKVSHCFLTYMELMYEKYYAYFGDQYEINDSGYHIQKYEKGGFYKEHHDFYVDFEQQTARIATFILYLNTVKNDGRTIFHEPVNTSVQPIAGSVLIFTATWDFLHSGEYVHDEKYIITGMFNIRPKSSQLS